MSKVHNFSAGPCILPNEVFEKSAESILNFNESGLSLIEISHRSADFVAVMEEARQLVREVLNVPDTYEVLFLQGGASLGFLTAAYNLMGAHKTGGYLVTGAWAKKAAKEASFMGSSITIASSEDKNFNYIPKNYSLENNIDYFHVTSNNTIFGTQIKNFYNGEIPLACDMSSDIFSRKINIEDFDLIYAGAQKNIGPSGIAIVIVRKTLLEREGLAKPGILDYALEAKQGSMFNTPPTFAWYLAAEVFEWLEQNGGVKAMEAQNIAKAKLLYDFIDESPFYTNKVATHCRSRMNVPFWLNDESLNEKFVTQSKEAGLLALEGHRIVGGMRASIYNAMPLAGVQALVDFMAAFAQEHS
jgi:phosphoserine aminotransferase